MDAKDCEIVENQVLNKVFYFCRTHKAEAKVGSMTCDGVVPAPTLWNPFAYATAGQALESLKKQHIKTHAEIQQQIVDKAYPPVRTTPVFKVGDRVQVKLGMPSYQFLGSNVYTIRHVSLRGTGVVFFVESNHRANLFELERV